MKSLVLFMLALVVSSASGLCQNLVPNGSFEEGITCPTQVGNVTLECESWYASLLSENDQDPTPDWFHTCSSVELYSPPEIVFGTQSTQDGEGYVGLFSFSTGATNARELVGVQLLQPLVSGQTYLVEFYLANIERPGVSIGSNRMGFNFSSHPFYNSNQFPLDTSHFSFGEIVPVSDEWILVSEIFLADSNYAYLHVGNFYSDENTQVDLTEMENGKTYCTIDNVSVSSVLSTTNETEQIDKMHIFPNPSNEQLNIAVSKADHIDQIKIYNSQGQLVFSKTLLNAGSYNQLDVSFLDPGLYTIQALTLKKQYYDKFIKM